MRFAARFWVLWCVAAAGWGAPLSVAAAAEGVVREVFPVPHRVVGMFQSGGLAVFDPFDPWEQAGVVPRVEPEKADAGQEGALLPAGEVFDLLPVWSARGFRPHAETRAFFHPGTHLIFARMAAEDVARVRAFCEWPPGFWTEEKDLWWRERGYMIGQANLRVEAWLVPAEGAGGWDFLPRTPEEFFALPASERRLAGRHSVHLRGGQRSLGKSGVPLGRGMEAEVEMTRADDGVTYNLFVKLETRVMADSGKPMRLNIAFEYLSTLGGQCLVEAGTFPGNPPRRLFYRCELLPGTGDAYTPPVLAEAVSRWTGQASAGDDRGPRVLWGASVLQLAILDKLYGPLPSPSPESRDPFADEGVVDRRGGELTATPMPEWFGAEAKVRDWSGRLEAAYQLPAGSTRFWITEDTAFLDGWDPASAGLKLPGNPLESEAARSMSLLETVLRHRPAMGAEGRIVSRTLLPLQLRYGSDASAGVIFSGPPTAEMPEEFRDWADFSVELRKEEQQTPGAAPGTTRSEVSEPRTGVVNLALSPPLVPAKLALRAEIPVDSTERPAPPARTAAALAYGGEWEMESRMVRLSSGAPPYPGSPVELWWRRRVSEKPLPAAAGN